MKQIYDFWGTGEQANLFQVSKGMLKLPKTKKRVTLSHHTGHATIANALNKTCF